MQRQNILQSSSYNVLQNSHNFGIISKQSSISYNSNHLSSDTLSPVKSNNQTNQFQSEKKRLDSNQDILDLMMVSNTIKFPRLRSIDEILEKWDVTSHVKQNQIHQTRDERQSSHHQNEVNRQTIAELTKKRPQKNLPSQIENNYFSIDFRNVFDKRQTQSKNEYNDQIYESQPKQKSSLPKQQQEYFKHTEQRQINSNVDRYHESSELPEVSKTKRTRDLLKKTILKFNNNNEIEDFFKMDDNFQSNQHNRKKKTLQNIYRLTNFTQWVEELYGKNWFSMSLEQGISPRRTQIQKIEVAEFMRGLNFDK